MTEEKKLSPITLAAGAVASVASMLVGSLLGDAGTLIGAAVGSITYSTGAYIVEDRTRRAHAKLKARRDQDKANAEPEKHYLQERIQANPLGEQALIRARMKQDLQGWNPRRKIAVAAGMLGLCLFAAIAVMITVEAATGKTLSSNLGGPAQYGTTLGGYSTHSPSPAPGVSSPAPSSTIPSVGSAAPSGVLPDATPDAVPDATPSATYTGISSGQ